MTQMSLLPDFDSLGSSTYRAAETSEIVLNTPSRASGHTAHTLGFRSTLSGQCSDRSSLALFERSEKWVRPML